MNLTKEQSYRIAAVIEKLVNDEKALVYDVAFASSDINRILNTRHLAVSDPEDFKAKLKDLAVLSGAKVDAESVDNLNFNTFSEDD